jgi:hypothetical protein
MTVLKTTAMLARPVSLLSMDGMLQLALALLTTPVYPSLSKLYNHINMKYQH